FATTYASVDRDLPKLIAEQKPDVVLMFGLAGRRRHICIETRARNAVSLLFPDASRHRPPHGTIALRGPTARRGNAPLMHLAGATRKSASPARLSGDAGRYLCNYLYWRALEQTAKTRPLVQFVHIPPLGRKSRRTLAHLLQAAEALLIA